MYDPILAEKLTRLRSQGEENQNEISEYSLKFYYTNQVKNGIGEF